MRDARDGHIDPGLDAAVPFRFACSRCGHCCSGGHGYAWLEADEVAPLARALDMTTDAFVALHVREAEHPLRGERMLALRERADGRCALLVGRNTCLAYESRPRHCRDFPYWPSVLRGGAGFEAARSTCPGIAVVVDPTRAETAFERLRELYARLDGDLDADKDAERTADRDGGEGDSARMGCCLDGAVAEELFMSALEADYAAAQTSPTARRGASATGMRPECRLGDARPVGCRLAQADAKSCEAARAEVRAIERETGHPVAYGAARALLAARGVLLAVRDEESA